MRLKGQVAIITGGSRGLGKAVALAFASEGAKVVVAARTQKPGGKLPGTIAETEDAIKAGGGTALAVGCDVTREDDVQNLMGQTLEAFGRIDVLVNNAGVNAAGLFYELPIKRWDLVINVNLRGTVLCTKTALPSMIERRSGRIINVSSMLARHASPGAVAYSVSKAAIEQFTIALAQEVRRHNIAVNALSPAGGVYTEGLAFLLKTTGPGRLASPDTFAEAAVILATQESAYSGEVIADQELLYLDEYARSVPKDWLTG